MRVDGRWFCLEIKGKDGAGNLELLTDELRPLWAKRSCVEAGVAVDGFRVEKKIREDEQCDFIR